MPGSDVADRGLWYQTRPKAAERPNMNEDRIANDRARREVEMPAPHG